MQAQIEAPNPNVPSVELFDLFGEPIPPTKVPARSKAPAKETKPKTYIEIVKPTKPELPRAKPTGEDRFYDVLHQFESFSELQILTKEEFDAAEALDPHNPAEEESESDLEQVQRMASAIFATTVQDSFDEFGTVSEQVIVDVFTISPTDSSFQRLAKAMFSRMLFDLAILTPTGADILDEDGLDLFGQIQLKNRKRDYAQMRKLDALIWVFDLSPEEPKISFEWVCEQLGFDEVRICRVIARSVKKDLRMILRYIEGMTDAEHTKACEVALSEFVNLHSWQDIVRYP
jgi:hypothetical protein